MNDTGPKRSSECKPLTAVIAMTPSGVIGSDGQLPWRLRSDLRRFKRLTMGGVLVMGRKTFDSIGKPLPGRDTIVITRQQDWSFPGVRRARNPEEAIGLTDSRPTFIVGGAEIYRQLLDRCDRIYLTRVFSGVRGDTSLEVDLTPFVLRQTTRIPAGPRDDVPTEFQVLLRFDGELRE